MKFEYSSTSNWENAIRGLRHPMESYAKSDSDFGIAENDDWLNEVISEVAYSYTQDKENYEEEQQNTIDWLYNNGVLYWGKNAADYAFIGSNDLKLAQKMIKAGTPNDKFLRQIFVSVDITAPEYFWSQLDTYKVGTVADSTSKMHKLATTPITKECFEMDDYNKGLLVYKQEPYNTDAYIDDIWDEIIGHCETLRKRYLKTKDERYWKELIRLLPESWLQTRTFTCNYAVLRNIVKWRKNHKLKNEWDSFIKWCQTLPYSSELIFYENGYENGYKLHDLLSSK